MRLVIIISAIVICELVCIVHSMTDAQMKSAVKLIRNLCQPKSKLTNEDISNIHKGVFDNPDYKCYMECVMRSGQLVKDGKFDFNSFTKQANNLDNVQRRDVAIAAATNCKNSIRSSEKCEAAYEIYSCIYNFNPEQFFLP